MRGERKMDAWRGRLGFCARQSNGDSQLAQAQRAARPKGRALLVPTANGSCSVAFCHGALVPERPSGKRPLSLADPREFQRYLVALCEGKFSILSSVNVLTRPASRPASRPACRLPAHSGTIPAAPMRATARNQASLSAVGRESAPCAYAA
jgi:hypothetical protein